MGELLDIFFDHLGGQAGSQEAGAVRYEELSPDDPVVLEALDVILIVISGRHPVTMLFRVHLHLYLEPPSIV